jgi:23S rRNA (pseudouridine1915-N3)-methyltransferase
MRLVVAAVGRLKDGPEKALFERYRERIEATGKQLGLSPVVWREIAESRAPTAARRSEEEGQALLSLAPDAGTVIALDQRGKQITSEAIARLLAELRDKGEKTAAIMIGGADGLSSATLAAARFKISFGAITLPHQLVRVILAEQLYRAATILAGHPYHRR